MIKFTGKVIGSNGVAIYENSLINLNIYMPNKYSGSIIQAEVGTEIESKQLYEEQEEIGGVMQLVSKESIIKSWNKFDVVYSFTTNKINPSFEELQIETLSKLQEAFPNTIFEIL